MRLFCRLAANGVYRALADPRRFAVPLDPRVLEILCCPLCHEALKERPDGRGLECAGCHRVYPIVGGIPNMLADEPAP